MFCIVNSKENPDIATIPAFKQGINQIWDIKQKAGWLHRIGKLPVATSTHRADIIRPKLAPFWGKNMAVKPLVYSVES